jgi:hypothetical protein
MGLLRYVLILTAVLASAPPIVSSVAAPQKQTAETATQFYLRWRATALNAKSMDEIIPFWTGATVQQFNMGPASARADTLPMLKRFYATQANVKVVNETATATGATLSLEGVNSSGKPIVAIVPIAKEDGAWKVTGEVEHWKAKGHS